jgi:hypothetical protein
MWFDASLFDYGCKDTNNHKESVLMTEKNAPSALIFKKNAFYSVINSKFVPSNKELFKQFLNNRVFT